MAYAEPIEQLIKAFRRLPSVGQRTAERYVFALLKSGKKDVSQISQALTQLMQHIQSCQTCWDFSDTSPCTLCMDTTREKKVICVVAEPQDLQAIERTRSYRGRYHVLRGLVRGDDERSVLFIKLQELIERIENEHTEEVILALNPDLHGQTTMMLIEQKIKEAYGNKVIVSRLARGLPMGSDLQYVDDVTLESAITHRTTK